MHTLHSTSLNPQSLAEQESLYTLGNGYLGVRGNFEEGYAPGMQQIRGSYINGVYARVDVDYAESAHGFPAVADKQPRLFDCQTLRVYLDGEAATPFGESAANYKRDLHLDQGFSSRSYRYAAASGKQAEIRYERMVSLNCRELFILRLTVRYDGEIRVESTLDTAVENYTNAADPRVAARHAHLLDTTRIDCGDTLFAEAAVKNSGLSVCCRVGYDVRPHTRQRHHSAQGVLTTTLSAYGGIEVVKYCIYCDSLRHDDLESTSAVLLKQAMNLGWDALLGEQREHYRAFWAVSDIVLEGDVALQMALRFSVFQLYQSTGRDAFSNISAKGLSGEGYEGHYFWDTEIYIFPYYLVTWPDMARSLLEFRHRQLPAARQEARNLGMRRGAKFAWRTISGIECSAYFPAGQAQYHINGDVCYGIIQYYLATGDEDFICRCGMQVLLEASLFLLEAGHFRGGAFCIDRVTGPDEYTAIVNNNFYTNLLARHAFRWSVRLLDLLFPEPGKRAEILRESGVTQQDLALFSKAADCMLLPHDDALGIDLQDENFLQLKEWDAADDKRPLLLHYHPLKIYAARILKQADTVLAHFLDEDCTPPRRMRGSYAFYEQRTTHDSSLSSCLYGMMACRIGDAEKAKAYFMDSVYLDLNNTHGNTRDGLHMANLAGSSMYFLYGFAGLRIKEDRLVLRPLRPADFPAYSFHIRYRGRLLRLRVDEAIHITLCEGEACTVWVYDRPVALLALETVRLGLESLDQ